MMALFGNIEPPPGVNRWGGTTAGLVPFLSAIIKILIVIAGIYAFFNLILAGYGFMSAGDDAKKMASSWAKIWQSLIGLLIIAGSFLLAAIFGWILFGNPGFILSPEITTAP